HLHDLMRDFDDVTLITRREPELLHGRPMRIVRREDDGSLWFLTHRETGKVDEIRRDGRSAVVMQSKSKFVFLAGTLTVDETKDTVEALWNPAFREWLPSDTTSRDVVALSFQPHHGEYWDPQGSPTVLEWMARGARALADSSSEGTKTKQHGKASL
ncbi:MAG: pyridoxamine 5'-phosphate oxidase family protein, partial [Myxococcales bacterium]|nr:pyridoxamine 5'-phosphate oxidase family protein [Myxococcales bacterium]